MAAWEAEKRLATGDRPASLWRAVWQCFRRDILVTAALKLVWSFFLLLSSYYFVRALTDFVGEKEPRPSTAARGYVLALGFFFSCMGMCVFQQQMNKAASAFIHPPPPSAAAIYPLPPGL